MKDFPLMFRHKMQFWFDEAAETTFGCSLKFAGTLWVAESLFKLRDFFSFSKTALESKLKAS